MIISKVSLNKFSKFVGLLTFKQTHKPIYFYNSSKYKYNVYNNLLNFDTKDKFSMTFMINGSVIKSLEK